MIRAAGLAVETYPYFDATANRLAFDALLETLAQLPEGDVVVLHGGCHNPTGIDPHRISGPSSPTYWRLGARSPWSISPTRALRKGSTKMLPASAPCATG